MASLDTLDPAALDTFRGELVEAGFEPRPGTDIWKGPIHPAFRVLTGAKTMRVRLHDGFPYRYPTLYVEGIDREHAVTDGEVCLFQPGEGALDSWITFSAFGERIEEWVEGAQDGLRDLDKLLDANLFYRPRRSGLATLKLEAITVPDPAVEAKGRLWGKARALHLQLSTRKFKEGSIPGYWYYCPALPDGPPRTLDGLKAALSKGQQANFERRLDEVGPRSPRVILFVWEQYGQRTAMALEARHEAGKDEPMVQAIEDIAFEDQEILALRAGPDIAELKEKRIAIFGCGAIGSNLACRLAEAGGGMLRLIDGDVLRPGNMVRHAAGFGVGYSKVTATELQISSNAPWTKVDAIVERPWGAKRLTELITDVDLVVETTGSTAFAALVSLVAARARKPMLTAALYREGFVSRVRRQVPDLDTPIFERSDPERYPLIPPGDESFSVETGCSALVNNASPIGVATVAATGAEVAVDALTGRFALGEELVDIYRPLEEAPFDSIGRLHR